MAELSVEGDELVVHLRPIEKVEGMHGDLRLPRHSVVSVEVLDDAVHAVQGFKTVGTALPGYAAIGTFRSNDRKTFAVVHHDTPRGVRVRLTDARFDELVIGCDAPEAVVAAIGPPAG